MTSLYWLLFVFAILFTPCNASTIGDESDSSPFILSSNDTSGDPFENRTFWSSELGYTTVVIYLGMLKGNMVVFEINVFFCFLF